jgi:hypothetical protein
MAAAPEILHVVPTPGGLFLLWRWPGGSLRCCAAPTWPRVLQVLREASADPELEMDGEAWAEALLGALREILRPGAPLAHAPRHTHVSPRG